MVPYGGSFRRSSYAVEVRDFQKAYPLPDDYDVFNVYGAYKCFEPDASR